jgi:hypothetical protein
MLAAARRDLGLRGRPNRITLSYSSRNGAEFRTAPWCDQSITEWARASGNADAVLPKGDRAFTVWHAQDGADLGRWHAGTVDNIKRYAKPAAIVFFDWGGTNNIGQIDHVGLIERVLPDGRIQTIEANTGGGSGAVLRRVRSADVVAGFWNPDYEGDDMPSAKEIADAVYERLTGTVTKDVWAAREGLMEPGTKLDPRTFIRQAWAYGKDGYAQSRAIRAELGALNAAVKTLAEALAQRDTAIDADALVARIREEIAQVTVRLDVSDTTSAS